jgi:hypothetical protein
LDILKPKHILQPHNDDKLYHSFRQPNVPDGRSFGVVKLVAECRHKYEVHKFSEPHHLPFSILELQNVLQILLGNLIVGEHLHLHLLLALAEVSVFGNPSKYRIQLVVDLEV